MDILQKTQELADSLVESNEYQKLVKARKSVESHQAAKVMLRDFHKKQMDLQQQQMEGKPVSENQADELRKLYEVLSINPYIRELFEAEFAFSGLMMEVQDIISKALGLNESDDEETKDAIEETKPPQKKLWTPGN